MKYATLINGLLPLILYASCSLAGAPIATETPLPTQTSTRAPTIPPTFTQAPTSTEAPTKTPRPDEPLGAFRVRTEFNGILDSDADWGGPDFSIAAGPTVLVLATNNVVVIMDKTGKVIDQKLMGDFIASFRLAGINLSTADPRLLYDPQTQRFFLVQSDKNGPEPECFPVCEGKITLAVSKSSAPVSLGPQDWYFYIFDRSLQKTADGQTRVIEDAGDFDNLAILGSVLAVSWASLKGPGDWSVGRQVRFIDLEPLLRGVSSDNWIDVTGTGGILAVNVDEPDSFFMVDSIPSDFRIWVITDPLAFPVVSSRKPLVLSASLNAPPPAPQLGGPTIDSMGQTAQAVHQGGSLWIATGIRKNFGSGIVGAIMWMQVDVSGWPETRVVQSGVLGQDAAWYFNPTIMVNELGDMSVFYVRSSADSYPSLYFAGRLAADPPGELRPANLLIGGHVAYDRTVNGIRNQYVDYMGMALDPEDGSAWMFGPYPRGVERSASWIGNIDWITVTRP